MLGEKMTSSRGRRHGILLSIVLALFLAMALAACSEADQEDLDSLLERAAELQATREAETSESPSLSGQATPEPTETGALMVAGPTTESTLELVVCPPGPATPPPAQTSAQTDKEALLAIFEATDGASWDSSGTWAGRAPISEWAGVTTDEWAGITPDWALPSAAGTAVPGEPTNTPAPLDSPGNGRVLGLTLNRGGAEIPPEVGHLTGLKTLRLSGVSGALPPELGYLVNLAELDLSDNRLCGEIPTDLGGLAMLQSLNLESNQLTGEIPPELGGLASMQSLDLSENGLTGEIPAELSGLESLQSLDLESNQLTGEIPAELGGLGSLQSLDLRGNRLTGDIPPELDNLASTLREILLDGNQLGCMSDFLREQVGYSGEVPACTPEDHPGDTDALIALYNAWGKPDRLGNWLSREPIGEWYGVTVDVNGRVVVLDLAGTTLTGEIPAAVGNLTSLQVLDLSDNDLTGEIPAELGSLASLQSLNLDYNGLTGEIPSELGHLLTSVRSQIGRAKIWIGSNFASVSAGGSHACGVMTGGAVACWGYDWSGKATPPEGQFASVSAGGNHTCGMKTDGAVACWGNDDFGQATPWGGTRQ